MAHRFLTSELLDVGISIFAAWELSTGSCQTTFVHKKRCIRSPENEVYLSFAIDLVAGVCRTLKDASPTAAAFWDNSNFTELSEHIFS